MKQLDNITDQANQVTLVVLDDSTILMITLVYRPATQRWTMDVFHPALTVNGINLCMHPNIMRGWRNVIPFGIAIATIDGLDPVNIEDFVSGRGFIYVLSSDEVTAVEANILGGVLQ